MQINEANINLMKFKKWKSELKKIQQRKTNKLNEIQVNIEKYKENTNLIKFIKIILN